MSSAASGCTEENGTKIDFMKQKEVSEKLRKAEGSDQKYETEKTAFEVWPCPITWTVSSGTAIFLSKKDMSFPFSKLSLDLKNVNYNWRY